MKWLSYTQFYAHGVKAYYKLPGRQMNRTEMLYRARARAKTPAAPATPMAIPPVGAGAPPVDCEEEGEADVELELESELEAEAEVESELEPEEVVEAEVVSAALEEAWLAAVAEPVSTAMLSAVSV